METLFEIAARSEDDPVLGRLVEHVGDRSRDAPCAEIYVPGRVELLGKHADYAGGSSLTFATSRGFRALAFPDDRVSGLTMTSARGGEVVRIDWADDSESPPTEAAWGVYPRAVVRRIVRHFGTPGSGVFVAFESDLPQAAGMSSSSALLTTAALSILCATDVSSSSRFRSAVTGREQLAEFLGAVEAGTSYLDFDSEEGVGTRGGAQDHASILCGEAGHISLFSYLPVQVLERIACPADVSFVICHSGVDARKTAGARDDYNQLSDLAARVGQAWADASPSAGSESRAERATLAATIADPYLDESRVIDVIDRIARDPEDRRRLFHRFAQFHDECTIVLPAAVEALRNSDWTAFAGAASTSQWMAEDWLENQVEETAYLVRSARAFDAPAASAFGAGFGGAVWALIPTPDADRFAERWVSNYRREYPEHADDVTVFVERPSKPAAWPDGAIDGID
ncbi:MAG: hypothetical protein HKN17_10955 [Rhodothermales bacterium]|nr:hypothetical protein [Rhodothermales bacterium]